MAEGRYVHVVYCEDIRSEVRNKRSLMGVFIGDMMVSKFPATLNKLCFFIAASTPADQPFQSLAVKILKDEEVLLDAPIPPADLESKQTAADLSGMESPRYTAYLEITAERLALPGPCTIRVRVTTEAGEMKAVALRIRQQETTSTP